MPFRKTWLKWTPKWSWRCLLASWGKEWRGCKAQWGGAGSGTHSFLAAQHGMPAGSVGTVSGHSQVSILVTLYMTPKSVYLFSQAAFPVLNKKCFILCKRPNLLQVFFYCWIYCLFENPEMKWTFQAPFLLFPLVKYRGFSDTDFNIKFQTNLIWLSTCSRWGPGGEESSNQSSSPFLEANVTSLSSCPSPPTFYLPVILLYPLTELCFLYGPLLLPVIIFGTLSTYHKSVRLLGFPQFPVTCKKEVRLITRAVPQNWRFFKLLGSPLFLTLGFELRPNLVSWTRCLPIDQLMVEV